MKGYFSLSWDSSNGELNYSRYIAANNIYEAKATFLIDIYSINSVFNKAYFPLTMDKIKVRIIDDNVEINLIKKDAVDCFTLQEGIEELMGELKYDKMLYEERMRWRHEV